MISDKHRKSLSRFEGKRGNFLYWITLLGPFVLVFFGVLNLWLAARIGSAGDFTLNDYMNIWLEAIDVTQEYSYSGIFLAGMHRFNTALLFFSFAIVLIPPSVGVVNDRKQNRAILNVLKNHHEI